MTAEEVPIPGTVHLIDLEGTMQATHGSGENKDLILIPTPTVSSRTFTFGKKEGD